MCVSGGKDMLSFCLFENFAYVLHMNDSELIQNATIKSHSANGKLSRNGQLSIKDSEQLYGCNSTFM